MNNLVEEEDINCIAQQPQSKITMIIAQMSALMNDTDNKVSAMESQKWYQRMIKTVFGKNKVTKNEIKENHDKLNAYMAETIAELFNRQCVDEKIILSLGTQISQIHGEQNQLKNMLYAFADKLNKKIESVDNFNILLAEIDNGEYSKSKPIISICDIYSQIDMRTINNSRKMEVLKKKLISKKIISDKQVLLKDYLWDVINCQEDDLSGMYLELCGLSQESFAARIITSVIESYHFLSPMEKKAKNKEDIITDIFKVNGLTSSVTYSMNEIYDNLLEGKEEAENSFAVNNKEEQNDAQENRSTQYDGVKEKSNDFCRNIDKRKEQYFKYSMDIDMLTKKNILQISDITENWNETAYKMLEQYLIDLKTIFEAYKMPENMYKSFSLYKDLSTNKIQDTTLVDKTSEIKKIADVTATSSTVIAGMAMGMLFPGIGTVASLAYGKQQKEKMDKEYEKKQKENSKILYTKICNEWNDKVNDNGKRCKCFGQEFFVIDDD